MKRFGIGIAWLLAFILALTPPAHADRMGVLLEEADGSPAGYVIKLKMPNGTVSSLANATGTIDLSSLGGGTVNGVGDCTTSADCLDGTSDGGTFIRLYDGTSSYTAITAGVRSFTVASGLANAEAFTVTLGDNNDTITVSSGTGANSLVLSSMGLTVGGTLALGANNLTMTGSLGATGARLTKIWAAAGEFTAAPTVNGVAANASSGLIVNPLTTQYDILVGGASGAATRLASSADVHTWLGSANLAAMKAGLSVDDLVTLSGVADGAVNLGTFTGSTIADSQTVKAALQSLETAVETANRTEGSGIDITAGVVSVDIHGTTEENTIASDDEIMIYDASAGANRRITRGNFVYGLGSGGGTILDLADNGVNESTGLAEIAVTGDTNSIFTEPSADKLLIAVGNKWPASNTADALAANGANCSSGQAPLGVNAAGVVEDCWTPYADPLTTRGDMLYRGASASSRLAIGTSGKILTSDGTDPGWSAYTVAAPGLTGAVLTSDGTNWTRNAAPAISAANMTSFPTLNQNTSGTASNLSGTPALPNGTTATTQSAGTNNTTLATTAYANALVSDTAYDQSSWNNVTGIAPSKNAVRDEIELRATKASPSFTGTVTLPTDLSGVLRANSGVVAVDSDVTDIVAAGSTSAAGKLQLATTSEAVTGTDSAKAVTAAGLTSRLAAPGAIGGTTPAAGTFTTLTATDLTATSVTTTGVSGSPGYAHVLEDPAYSGTNYRGFGMLSGTDYPESIEYKFPSGNNSANAFWLLGAPFGGSSTMTYGGFGSEFTITGNTVSLTTGGVGISKIAATGTPSASTVLYGNGTWGSVTAAASGSDGYLQFAASSALSSDAGLSFNPTTQRLSVGKSGTTGGISLLAETGSPDRTYTLAPQPSGMGGDIVTYLPASAFVAGDTVVATATNQLGVVAKGTAYQIFGMNSGATAPAWTSTLGATGTRLTAGYFTDLAVTNAIAGSVTGNAATVTIADAADDTTTFPLLGTAATGPLAPATDSSLTYNASTGNLGATILTAGGAAFAGGTNTFSITNGTASLDIAAAATLNIDSSLQVQTGPLVLTANAGGSSVVTIPNGTVNLAVGTVAVVDGALGNATATSLSFGADPGDSGAIRLSNNTAISWEPSTPGTDIFVALDSSDIFQVGQNANNIYLGTSGLGNVRVTGDLTVWGSDINLGDTGVKITGDGDGAITFLGMGDGADEDLTINLDDTANEVTVSSSTGVAQLRLAQGMALGANINLVTKTTNATLTVAEMNGIVFMTGAGTVDLPEIVASSPSASQVVPGAMVCIAERDDNEQVVINPHDNDSITLDGTKGTAGASIQNTVAAATGGGDYLCVVAVEADNWLQMGKSGTWGVTP